MSRFRLYDFDCKNCNQAFEYTVDREQQEEIHCPYCDSSNVSKAINAHAGYSGDTGGASQRPRGAGSFKRRKV